MTGTRERLSQRRICETVGFTFDNQRGIARFSRFDAPDWKDGDIAELFVDIGRPGSGLRAATNAAAVMASIALQRGAPIDELRNALPKLDDGSPAEPLGAAVEAILKEG